MMCHTTDLDLQRARRALLYSRMGLGAAAVALALASLNLLHALDIL